MKLKKSMLILREIIRELAEDGFDRNELTAFVTKEIRFSYENPLEAKWRSYRDLEELGKML